MTKLFIIRIVVDFTVWMNKGRMGRQVDNSRGKYAFGAPNFSRIGASAVGKVSVPVVNLKI